MHKDKEISIDTFSFVPGRILAKKYEVIGKLGEGWEGEVYLVRELITGIERAAKFFFPQRNPKNAAVRFYANKLHKLRHCPILIQYLTQETIMFQKIAVTFLVSDYVEGELISVFLARQPGKRLSAIQGLHLLHALASGIENIHHMGEYHGDLHMDNIWVTNLSYWTCFTGEHQIRPIFMMMSVILSAFSMMHSGDRQDTRNNLQK